MLKLKSGRIVFFEGIVGMAMEGSTLVLELATKEKIELAGVTIDDMLKRRNDYFGELFVSGSITKDFGDKVYSKLKGELETAISTLQSATTAYNTSAELANKASKVLAGTSDRVDLAADKVFTETQTITKRAANRFSNRVDDISESKLDGAVNKLVNTIDKLATELDYIED